MTKKLSVKLSILWICSYAMMFLGVFIYTLINMSNTGFIDCLNIADTGYQIFICIAVLCYFLPLAGMIRYFAQKEKRQKLKAIASIVVIFLSVWSVLSIVAIVYQLWVNC